MKTQEVTYTKKENQIVSYICNLPEEKAPRGNKILNLIINRANRRFTREREINKKNLNSIKLNNIMTKKYKEIINSTQEELEKKYPWLKDADFEEAVIQDWGYWITWKGGTWKGGVWEDGVWEDGVWKGGIWKGGKMWSNIDQCYLKVEQKEGKFIQIK